jgi:hypothetical protein
VVKYGSSGSWRHPRRRVHCLRAAATLTAQSNVEAYLAASGQTAEGALQRLQQGYNKYKFLEYQLAQNKAAIKTKVPDIKKTLDAVRYLQSKRGSAEPVRMNMELSDALYTEAVIDDTDRVCLWLGVTTPARR